MKPVQTPFDSGKNGMTRHNLMFYEKAMFPLTITIMMTFWKISLWAKKKIVWFGLQIKKC